MICEKVEHGTNVSVTETDCTCARYSGHTHNGIPFVLEKGWMKRQNTLSAAATDKWPDWMKKEAGIYEVNYRYHGG